MWKSTTGHDVKIPKQDGKQQEEDDWDSDPNFVNTVSEKDQRWGSKAIDPNPGKKSDNVDLAELRKKVVEGHDKSKMAEWQSDKAKSVKESYGVGKTKAPAQ